MDTADFRILEILNKNSRKSYLSIAKDLGISGKTVQKRIERMIREGVILSFEIGFDASLLGLNTCIADIKLKGEFTKHEIIAEFKKIPNIYFVTCAIGNILTLIFHYYNSKELENIIERISFIEHVSNVETNIPRGHHFTEVDISPLDWKIIHRLNHNARKKNHEIASELEVSPKTIKRRLDKLVKDRIIYFTIDVDSSKAKNFTTYVLIVKLETGVKKEKIYKEIKNKFGNIWATVGPVQPSIAFFMYSRSLSQIEDVVEQVKMITEVKTANIALYTSFHRFTEWYDKKIENMTKNNRDH